MSRHEADKSSADSALSDAALRNSYRELKADQPMPQAIKRRIMQQAARADKQHSWRSWWYFSQFAMGCAALVLVLSWVNPAKQPLYYQINTITQPASGNTAEAKVQWHHLTASVTDEPQSSDMTISGAQQNSMVHQRLNTLKEQQRKLQQAGSLSIAMHRQVGLLTQQQDQWHIALCDSMQLNLAMELVQELNAQIKLEPVLIPQWVELQFSPSGHILAIAALPASQTVGNCAASDNAILKQQT